MCEIVCCQLPVTIHDLLWKRSSEAKLLASREGSCQQLDSKAVSVRLLTSLSWLLQQLGAVAIALLC